MSRKHIDVDVPHQEPVPVRTILTGELNIPLEGKKPELRLIQMSNGNFEVVYQAYAEPRGRVFHNLDRAIRYFETLVGLRPVDRRMVA